MNNLIPYKTILAEIRPVFQSVIVFIIFKETIGKDCKIELTDAGFNIIKGDATEVMKLNKIVAKRNLSVLAAKENYLVFKFSTEEQPKASALKPKIYEQPAALQVPEQTSLLRETKINCMHCSEELSNTVFKTTIISHFGLYEPNEWYCNSENIPECSVRPKKEEFLISPTGYYVAKEMVVDKIKELDNCLVCYNCLTLIGRVVIRGTYKLYFDAIRESTWNNLTISHPLPIRVPVHRSQNKLILILHLPENQKEYLLLWVIEEDLLVYKINENREVDTASTSKVLFKHLTSFTSLVEQWCKDFDTIFIDFSPNMMHDTLQFLHETNSLIPAEFSSSNGFYVSFLRCQRND